MGMTTKQILQGVKNWTTISAVYDVSAHFPTGGVNGGNTYTLSGAIAMVPNDIRKGGMSIRFVSSSDNKYVQYRLMSDTFSTTESDWQGVDDEPTAGSKNLAESGGIEECIFNNGKPFNTVTSYKAGDNYLWKTLYPNPLIQGQRYKLDVAMNSASMVKFTLGLDSDRDKQNLLNTATDNSIIFVPEYSDTTLRIRCGSNIAADTGDINVTLTKLLNDTSVQYDSNNAVENQAIHAVMKMDRGAFNVSAHYPTSGVDGGNTYTLSGAISVIPSYERSSGCVITFIDSVLLEYVRYKFKVNYQNISNWVDLNNWERVDNFKFSTGESLNNVGISNNPIAGDNNLAKGKHVFLLNGLYAKNLLVNTVGASSRIGVHFPIDDPTKTFHVKYSNSTGANMQVAVLNSEKYTSGGHVQIIYTGNDSVYEADFTIDSQNYENAKYIGIFFTTENSSWSFTLDELYITESVVGNSRRLDDINSKLYSNLQILSTHANGIIYNTGNENIGYWFSSNFSSGEGVRDIPLRGTKYVTHIYDVRDFIGKRLNVHCVPRNNQLAICFVTDYTLIPNSKDLETWNNIFVGRVTTNISSPQDHIVTVPENGNYMVVTGSDLDPADANEGTGIFHRLDKIDYEIDEINERIDNIDPSNTSDIIKLNDEKLTVRKIENAKRLPRADEPVGITPLLLLHFSDIHLDTTNMARIKEFADHYSSYINDVICTGDIVNNINNDWSFWDNNGGPNYLITIGNHESYKTNSPSNTTVDSPNDVYDVAIAPYISNWGNVVQPENAAIDGKCYYYKDYAAAKVRLIVLCAYSMNGTNYLANENTWLQTVLADAITNDLSVLIAIHAVAGNQNGFDCSFNAIQKSYSIADVPSDFKSSVNAFITNGGDFVGYIGGHTHIDVCGVDSTYTNQVKIAIDTASVVQATSRTASSDAVHENNTKDKSYDCFNLIAIDTYQKLIKIIRIGVDIDSWMRKKDTMCIQYASSAAKTITTPEVVYCT